MMFDRANYRFSGEFKVNIHVETACSSSYYSKFFVGATGGKSRKPNGSEESSLYVPLDGASSWLNEA